jgi:hypothetical protein
MRRTERGHALLSDVWLPGFSRTCYLIIYGLRANPRNTAA